MSELRGIYTLWRRETKRFMRERTRFVSSFVQPLLWLVIFGSGLGSAADAIGLGITYDMLLDALSDAGGETTLSVRYPINDTIRRKLRKLLWKD